MGVGFKHNTSILVICHPLVEMHAFAHHGGFAADMQGHKHSTLL